MFGSVFKPHFIVMKFQVTHPFLDYKGYVDCVTQYDVKADKQR